MQNFTESLWNASSNGNLENVKHYINKGANIHSENNYALRLACQKSHLNIIKYLIEKGADIHSNNEEPLRWACFRGNTEIIKYLIEKGANLQVNENIKSLYGFKTFNKIF